jgi:hypothetical protein
MEGGRLVCDVAGALAREGWRRAAQWTWWPRAEPDRELGEKGCRQYRRRSPFIEAPLPERPGFAAPRTTNANGRRYGMGTERMNRPRMLAVDNMDGMPR